MVKPKAGDQQKKQGGHGQPPALTGTDPEALEKHQARKDGVNAVTIKEFSNKYDVPYHLCYEASYKVRPVETMRRDKDFPEDLLFMETKALLQRRSRKHQELLSICQRAEVNMNRRRADG